MTKRAAMVTAIVFGGLACLWAAGCSDPDSKMQSSDRAKVIEGIRELASKQNDEAVSKIAAAVSHQDEVVAAEAVRGLGEARRSQAVQVLKQVAVQEKRPVVREEAVVQLGLQREKDSAEALRQAIKTDPDPRVRAAAATALARVGLMNDVALLVDVAETDPDLMVQSRAVGAVERMIGMKFGYDVRAPQEQRAKALARMRGLALIGASARQAEKGRPGG